MFFLQEAAPGAAGHMQLHDPVFHRLPGCLENVAAHATKILSKEIPAEVEESVWEASPEQINRELRGCVVQLANGTTVVTHDENENASIVVPMDGGALGVMSS